MGATISLQELASRRSIERKGDKPLSFPEVGQYLRGLPGWGFKDNAIEKEYRFSSYIEGLDFAHSVGKLAEVKDHHPDILIKWRRVKLSLSTHSIGGLSENDFIIAANAELLYNKSSQT